MNFQEWMFSQPWRTQQHRVDTQLLLLGLDPSILYGYKILDIGCGKDARLVKHLIAHGIKAEGIDPNVKDDTFLMKQEVIGVKPMLGHIPREDGTYNLVVAHMHPDLYGVMTCSTHDMPNWMDPGRMPEMTALQQTVRTRATYIINEAARVMKPNARFLYFPSVPLFEDEMRSALALTGLAIVREEITIDGLDKTINQLIPRGTMLDELMPEKVEAMRQSFRSRTIVYKS